MKELNELRELGDSRPENNSERIAVLIEVLDRLQRVDLTDANAALNVVEGMLKETAFKR
jgi:hypothetical protein